MTETDVFRDLIDRAGTLPFLGLIFVSRGHHVRALAWHEEGLAAYRAALADVPREVPNVVR